MTIIIPGDKFRVYKIVKYKSLKMAHFVLKCNKEDYLSLSLSTHTHKAKEILMNKDVVRVRVSKPIYPLNHASERIMFITHLKPLQPKTAITDDLHASESNQH